MGTQKITLRVIGSPSTESRVFSVKPQNKEIVFRKLKPFCDNPRMNQDGFCFSFETNEDMFRAIEKVADYLG